MVANLAHDFGPNIRINAVGPGAICTAALEKVLNLKLKRMLSHTPLQRLGEPEDIARAVLFFASPISSWISGQTLFVNGGVYKHLIKGCCLKSKNSYKLNMRCNLYLIHDNRLKATQIPAGCFHLI